MTTPECVPLCTGQMSCWSSRMRQDLAQSSRTSHPSVESGSAFSCKVAGHRYLLGKLLPTPVAVWALVRSRGTKTLTGQTSSHSCCYLSSRAKSRDKDTCWVLLTPVAVWVLVRSRGIKTLAGQSSPHLLSEFLCEVTGRDTCQDSRQLGYGPPPHSSQPASQYV